jgi:hypothetical protein
MELKYIIVAEATGPDTNGEERAIVFDPKLIHRDVARIHSATNGPRLISAGFCDLLPRVIAYGESESLRGKKSRGDVDAAIIQKSLFGTTP